VPLATRVEARRTCAEFAVKLIPAALVCARSAIPPLRPPAGTYRGIRSVEDCGGRMASPTRKPCYFLVTASRQFPTVFDRRFYFPGEGRAPPRPQQKRGFGLLCFGVCGCSALKTNDYSCRRIVAALKRLDL
jgi:hypothetical protein